VLFRLTDRPTDCCEGTITDGYRNKLKEAYREKGCHRAEGQVVEIGNAQRLSHLLSSCKYCFKFVSFDCILGLICVQHRRRQFFKNSLE